MSWDPPEDKNSGKKPSGENDKWSGGGDPNDLDKAVIDFMKRLSGNKKNKKPVGFAWLYLAIIALVGLGLWKGFYIVAPGEKGVVLRFGQYQTTVASGPHWKIPLVDAVYKVDEQKRYDKTYSEKMLTKDIKIVSVPFTIEYRIDNARSYKFSADDPVATLEQVTESSVRYVIGNTELDDLLTGDPDNIEEQVQASQKRIQIQEEVLRRIHSLLEEYDKDSLGIEVIRLGLEAIKAPEEVQDAYNDAVLAISDKKRAVTVAEKEKNRIDEQARGEISKITQSARAYKKSKVLQAQAEVVGFERVFAEYRKSPENAKVLRKKMYIESMRQALSNSQSVFVDVSSGNNVMYLPIEQMLKSGKQASMADSRGLKNISINDKSATSLPGVSTQKQLTKNRPVRDGNSLSRERPSNR